jgi:hypothetical protein
MRGAVAVDGDCKFAGPVPVRRPGVRLMGVDERDDAWCSGTASDIGRTKIGLNLDNN